LDAYRRLFDLLEKQGQGDLRALLVEQELARTMDELIQRAAHGRAEGLRALGSTAQLDLERFRRMVIISQRVVNPESPPLTSFLEALQLFADAFESSGGFRLTRIARPPILFYGLYGTTTLEDADRRLLDLIVLRGLLADELDCFLQCGCTPENIKCQIVLDKILYDVDRAIDLYALGKDDFGEPERRAAVFSYIIQSFLFTSGLVINPSASNGDSKKCKLPDRLFQQIMVDGNQFRGLLIEIQGNLLHLLPPLVTSPPNADPDLVQMLNDLVDYADRVRDKLEEGSICQVPINNLDICQKINNIIGAGPPSNPFIIPANLQGMTDLFRFAKIGEAHLLRNGVEDVPTSPPSVNAFLGILQQELCIQEDMEERWRNLVKSMAPNCFGIDAVLNAVEQVIEGAIDLVSGEVCPIFQPSIPPHYETTLDSLANDVDRLGGGR
jgi:hypothetical protein